jgi:hypothetical protein
LIHEDISGEKKYKVLSILKTILVHKFYLAYIIIHNEVTA